MPSKSPAQARLMAMVSHNPDKAKKTGVPVSVAKEFNAADKGTGIIKPKAPTMSAKSYKAIVSGATKATSKLKPKVKDLDKDGDSKKDTDNDGM